MNDPYSIMALGIAAGVGLGAVFGAAMDDPAVGIGMGIAIGAGIGAIFGQRRGK
ncbi:hypothetical protein LB566_16960 [Mesorhizobium sp. CA13]|uniref:hypothetical protein n=1 Tax=unclassified Mesorhizobium TaxID=325217 RepID=UPI0015E35E12|nr:MULTISPECIES: hypothetical protein [unclassified Mesorhizobium]MBZ9855499.1 hypothetical protein [Mesorhizobium sp. CA13]MBZ9966788.1 hypothetical protein [Mesorhizobium sp. BR1-1-2]MCA0011505.1 hypothetical protein [Mesorhizobium sp. B294B1A1]MCA0036923.1 hypothetical protein [Mesorhizobium sp. B292B1B]